MEHSWQVEHSRQAKHFPQMEQSWQVEKSRHVEHSPQVEQSQRVEHSWWGKHPDQLTRCLPTLSDPTHRTGLSVGPGWCSPQLSPPSACSAWRRPLCSQIAGQCQPPAVSPSKSSRCDSIH